MAMKKHLRASISSIYCNPSADKCFVLKSTTTMKTAFTASITIEGAFFQMRCFQGRYCTTLMLMAIDSTIFNKRVKEPVLLFQPNLLLSGFGTKSGVER